MKKMYFFAQVTLISGSCFAQTLVGAAGGSEKNNVQLDWSMGEAIIGTYESNSVIVFSGFQQPLFAKSDNGIVGIENEIPAVISVFPNPFANSITVVLPEANVDKYEAEVVTLTGVRVDHKYLGPATDNRVEFDGRDWPVAPCILILKSNNNQLFQFKIIKQ